MHLVAEQNILARGDMEQLHIMSLDCQPFAISDLAAIWLHILMSKFNYCLLSEKIINIICVLSS